MFSSKVKRPLVSLFAILSLALVYAPLVGAQTASAASFCNGTFQGNPDGSLAISATRGGSALADGSSIAADDVITIRTTWNTGDWSSLNKVLNCFQLNGSDLDALDIQVTSPDNDGLFTYTFTVPGTVADGDTLCVRGDLAGTPTGGNVSTQKSNKLCWGVAVPPPTNPDVVVSKSASDTSINSGDSVTFTLTATNSGSAKATDVVITDTFPAGLTITGASASCNISGQKVTCNVGDLAAGAHTSVTIDVTATPDACPSVTNQAHVAASNEPAGNQDNNDSNVVTLNVTCPPPTNPDVVVSKSASDTSINSGDSVTFTLTATNSGSAKATDVVITDTFPAGLTITGASSSCNISGQKVTCNVGDLAAGAHTSVTIDVTATPDACPSVTNQAHVAASNEPAGNQSNNDSNRVTLNVTCPPPGSPDVVVSKSTSSTSVNSGDSFTFTVTATNSGSADADGVRITDTIPAGLTITGASFTGGSNGPGSCSVNGQDVLCAVGTVSAGHSATAIIDVAATDSACPSIANKAKVSADNEPAANQGNNDSNTVTVSVTCITPPPPTEPDVEIQKSTSAPATGVAPGDSFDFTLSATNTGGTTANDVVITDTVPAGLNVTGASFAGGSAGSGNCGVNGQDVTCNVGNLGAGNSVTVTIDVTATDAACPNITNNAHVSASNEPSANQGNNDSNDVTVIVTCTPPPPIPGVHVSITKTNNADGKGGYSDNEEAPQPGSDVPFLLIITNTGTPDITLTSLVDMFGGQSIDLINGPCSQLAGMTLTAGESVACNFTLKNYSPPASSSGKVNTAKVCAQNMTGDKTNCDQDDSKVTSGQVQGKTITPSTPPGGTAFTGSNGTVSLALLTLLLLLLGSGFVFVSNRRRRLAEGI